MKQRSAWRNRLEYVVFRVLVCLIELLPPRASVAVCRALAFVVHRCLPRQWTRYETARENLRTAFGTSLSDEQADHLIHEMWIHLFRMVTEIVQLPRKLRLYNCADIIHFRNRDQTVRMLCSGRPVILLGGHFGNWEMANVTLGMFGFPVGVVARDFDNPLLHGWFQNWRQQTGTRLIPKKGGAGEMMNVMERRGSLAMLCDQDAGKRGLFVPFFGKEASTFKSIALLALQYRAVIAVGYARRLPDDFRKNRWVRYELGCEDFIDTAEYETADALRQITERYTAALERVIRKSPEQYFWVHRRWKSRPGACRRQQRRSRRAA